jgi:hypothetical protein
VLEQKELVEQHFLTIILLLTAFSTSFLSFFGGGFQFIENARTMDSLVAGGIAGAIFGLCALFFCIRCWQQRKNRLSLATQAQLDADEKRFKRRIEREGARSMVGGGGRQIDELFDDDLDGGDDDELELNAREIEQLQILEADLARRARGGGGGGAGAGAGNASIKTQNKSIDAASRKLESALAAVVAHGETNDEEEVDGKFVDEPVNKTTTSSSSAPEPSQVRSKRV